jgi:hypothetical protein
VQLDPHSKTPGSRKRIATSLAAATCALLGAGSGPSVAQEPERRWRFDTALMYYGETDRVRDVSANFLVQRIYRDFRNLTLKLTVDSLTGASANGAAPARTAQTFTTPSGSESYTAAAGETPLDATFLDTRLALSAGWSQRFGKMSSFEAGLSVSNEFDYFHAGINGSYSRDFNQRNTTLSVGVAFASDTVDPVGGAPVPLTQMLPENDLSNRLGSDSKTVGDLTIGVTQVFGRRTVTQFNYGFSRASGYLTDGYKVISVVDPVTGDPVAGPGSLNRYLFEGRPDSRTKHTIYGAVRHHLSRDIVSASYRFMTDDWGIDSHTIDFRYRFKLAKSYIQPHARYYMQGQADFYVRTLFDGDPVPVHATADYRLGEFDAYTLGVKYGRPHGKGKEWGVRVEYYSQSGTSPPGAAVGALADLELNPTVNALIFQVGYRF